MTFTLGKLNFNSTHFDWLVIDPETGTAQFKGSGSLDGVDGYQFGVWVSEVKPSTFRIRIWSMDGVDENLVYDTLAPQMLGGGKVTLHK